MSGQRQRIGTDPAEVEKSGSFRCGHSRHAAAAQFRVSVSFVVNLVKAFRVRGSLAPKPTGGRRHAKLAAELAAAPCEKADPASLSRWLIRIGYRLKNVWPARLASQAPAHSQTPPTSEDQAVSYTPPRPASG
jgi:hypothetical protein